MADTHNGPSMVLPSRRTPMRAFRPFPWCCDPCEPRRARRTAVRPCQCLVRARRTWHAIPRGPRESRRALARAEADASEGCHGVGRTRLAQQTSRSAGEKLWRAVLALGRAGARVRRRLTRRARQARKIGSAVFVRSVWTRLTSVTRICLTNIIQVFDFCSAHDTVVNTKIIYVAKYTAAKPRCDCMCSEIVKVIFRQRKCCC